MLVATFGPTTAWVGKTITCEGDQFILEEHGRITPAAIVQYDAQGHLTWTSDGLRQWVYERATTQTSDAQPSEGTMPAASTPSHAGAAPPDAWHNSCVSDATRSLGAPGIGVAGFVCVLVGLLVPLVGIVGLVLSILGYRQATREDRSRGLALAGMIIGIVVTVSSLFLLAVAVPAFLDQRDKAKDSAVKEGIHSIQVGIQIYAVDNDDAYPDPAMVSESGLASSVDFWPTNPYTGLPMTQGTGQGDFRYTVSEDGRSFQVTGYGKGGEAIITVP
jgi:type II secretory pathway pseudopilin PulG